MAFVRGCYKVADLLRCAERGSARHGIPAKASPRRTAFMARQTKRAAVAALKSLTRSQESRAIKKSQRSGYVGDLRPWLAQVDALGELQPVAGADWNKE